MHTFISYDNWLENMILSHNDAELSNLKNCKHCEYSYDPCCYECYGTGIIIYDTNNNSIDVSSHAYYEQKDKDRIIWEQYKELNDRST